MTVTYVGHPVCGGERDVVALASVHTAASQLILISSKDSKDSDQVGRNFVGFVWHNKI